MGYGTVVIINSIGELLPPEGHVPGLTGGLTDSVGCLWEAVLRLMLIRPRFILDYVHLFLGVHGAQPSALR